MKTTTHVPPGKQWPVTEVILNQNGDPEDASMIALYMDLLLHLPLDKFNELRQAMIKHPYKDTVPSIFPIDAELAKIYGEFFELSRTEEGMQMLRDISQSQGENL